MEEIAQTKTSLIQYLFHISQLCIPEDVIQGTVRPGNCPFKELSVGERSDGELFQNRKNGNNKEVTE